MRFTNVDTNVWNKLWCNVKLKTKDQRVGLHTDRAVNKDSKYSDSP